MATPPHYSTRPVFGPFHREASDTQTPAAMREILLSGVLWGHPARWGGPPVVQAYNGPLRDGREGFEFYALAAPDRPHGPVMSWRERADGAVVVTDETAKLNVLIRLVRQKVALP